MASADVPKFSLTGDRYDMDSFWGRLYHRFRLLDPRGLAVTDAQLREYQQLTKRAAAGEDTGKTDEELWSMRFVLEGSVHPTTDEIINPMFRMSAYIPLNIPIVGSMTVPAVVANPVATGTVHFINQSLNCAVNYANRSGDSQSSDAIMKAYAAAVSASLAGGLGATWAVKRVPPGGLGATVVRATLPFCAVVASGCANVSIMRWAEWQGDGVPVTDEEGNVRGKSVLAGKNGMYQCWFARFAWNIPPMMMPPLLAAPLASIPFFKTRMMAVEGAICLTGIVLGLPAALAYFKPYTTISADQLEPEFQNLKNSKGEPVKSFTFYKGI